MTEAKTQRTPFLMILCGLPSSGKSTLAQKVAELLETSYGVASVVVASDTIRKMIPAYQKEFDHSREKFVTAATHSSLELAVNQGYFVISDDMNYFESMRKRLKDLAIKHRIGYGIIHVETPQEIAKEWNKKRGEPVPNSLIDEVAQKFDRPGKKYAWDKPLLSIDSAQQPYESLAKACVEKALEKLKSLPTSIKKSHEASVPSRKANEIERITRKTMGELMSRYKRVDLANEFSLVRRRIVGEALRGDLEPDLALTRFRDEAERLLAESKVAVPRERMIVHFGLFGHVDHGKTMLASALTEKASTAALDKHPESKRRGMTIDMGFSAFNLDKYLVTLVDLPGHYSLVRHAMAGASIVDMAILVVAADEGVNAQTLEHLAILFGSSVRSLVVAINKKDLVRTERLAEVKEQVGSLLAGTKFQDSPMVEISALNAEGINELKSALKSTLKPPVREWIGPLRLPVDHAFHVSGAGTVVTGTILRGSIKRGEEVSVMPPGKAGKVRLIQIFGEDVAEAGAGDRVGVALGGLKAEEIKRGYVVTTPGSLSPVTGIEAEVTVHSKLSQSHKSWYQLSVGLSNLRAILTPFKLEADFRIIRDQVLHGETALCRLILQTPIAAEKGDDVIIFRSELPPKSSRIVATGKITKVGDMPPLYRSKVKVGKIERRIEENTFLVRGLFQSEDGAKRYVGKTILAESGVKGKIVGTANGGAVATVFDSSVGIGEEASLTILREIRV